MPRLSSLTNAGLTGARLSFGPIITSYTLTPAANNINEGSELTFTVGGSNIVNGTYYWTINNTTTAIADFGDNSGSFTITNNSGSFSVTPTADTTTEGSEIFTVSIRSGSISGTIVATSGNVTIADTSISNPVTGLVESVGSTNLLLSPDDVITTSQFKYGTKSLYCPGTTYANRQAYTFPVTVTLPFTVEYWVRLESKPSAVGTLLTINATSNPFSEVTPNNNFRHGYISNAFTQFTKEAGSGTSSQSSYTIPDDQWIHVAQTYLPGAQFSNGYIFINGTILELTNWSSGRPTPTYLNTLYSITIGGSPLADTLTPNDLCDAYFDDIRISNYERYTTNFTPPAARLTVDANTVALIQTTTTTYTVTPAANNVNEGSNLTFTVSGSNIANGTYYWTVSRPEDFAVSSGSFTITSNSGSFSVTPTADTTTEGVETFTASVRTGSIGGTVVATSSSVTINDTSTLPDSSLLLHFDSSPGLLVDSSSNALTMTNLGTKAVINTTTSKFGTASMQLTGSTFENTLTLTNAALPLVTTGSRVTFECWVYFDDVSTQSLGIRYSNSTVTNGFDLQLLSGGLTNISYWGDNGVSPSYATGFTSGTWNHIAWAFHWGTSLYIFVNGIQRGSTFNFSGLNNSRVTTTPKLQLVRNSGPSGNILIDEFRIVAGLIAQGTPANNGIQVFTPPSAPYTS